MSWLSGWSKRIEIIVDKDQVDSNLENFPVPIYLSASSGQNNDDVSAIFDELITVSGTKKIAITTDDEETQCYVEIERWDWTNEKAWLHAKIPTIASGTDTTLYIYYDSTQSDNTSYIGDVGSIPGQAVWDSDFKLVLHMGEDPNGDVADAIKDSTSNTNHGSPSGGMATADLVDGQFGKCLDFDGVNDEVSCGSDAELDDITLKTIEAFVSPDNYGENLSGRLLCKSRWYLSTKSSYSGFEFSQQATAHGIWTCPLTLSTFQHIAVTFDRGLITNVPLMYVDGASATVTQRQAPSGSFSSDATYNFVVGGNAANAFNNYNGKTDEVRVSSVIRTAAWIKTTSGGLWDDLLIFGEEEGAASTVYFTFSNPTPTQSGIVYGVTQQLCLTTTISGPESNYTYDAVFYNNVTSLQIGSTISGVQSGVSASVYMDTPLAEDYSWYMNAASSGTDDTSDIYTFKKRFLFSGDVYEGSSPASGIPVSGTNALIYDYINP
jgi:hypothetical protein